MNKYVYHNAWLLVYAAIAVNLRFSDLCKFKKFGQFSSSISIFNYSECSRFFEVNS